MKRMESSFVNKKLFTLISFMMGIMVSLGGCRSITGSITQIQGTGEMVSRPYTTDSFNSINISGSFNVTYRHSGSTSVNVEMQQNLFAYIDVSVRDDTLYVGFGDTNINTIHDNIPRIYIYAPYLEAARFSGNINTMGWDTIRTSGFRLNASGSGNITIPMQVSNLNLTTSGSTNLTLSGSATIARIYSSGSSNIFAGDLRKFNTYVQLTGNADVLLGTSDGLSVDVNNNARLRYKWAGVLSKRISGSGLVYPYEY